MNNSIKTEKKINIVHFGKYYFPDEGGIESVNRTLAKGAALRGHTVTVVCFQKNFANQEEILDGVNVIRTPISKLLASQPLGFKYFLKCYSYGKNADLIHLHAPNMLATLCVLFIPTKIPLLVHWHSDVIKKGFLEYFVKPLVSVLLRRADAIVVTSPVYGKASKALSIFQEKIKVVPIGAPDVMHENDRIPIKLEIDLKVKGKKIILAVGRLVPYKGFDILIEAAKYLTKDAVIVVVGGGLLQDKLQESIRYWGMEERVLLVGRVSDAELHALFRHAYLFCLPSISRAEAFGVVLLEAMAYGLPLVTSDIPGSGVSWVNQHGVSGLNFTVGDSHALAQACNQILVSQDLKRKLANGSRQRFLSEFTENISINSMLEIYKQLI